MGTAKITISGDRLKIIAKPNARKNEVLGFDEARGAYKIAIAAPPEKDKANVELLKFMRKLTGKRWEIITGGNSREKMLRLLR